MGIGVKHSSEVRNISTEGYWSAVRQQTPYSGVKQTNYHDFNTKTKRCFRKRLAAQLPANVLICLIVILVTISCTAMITVVNGDSNVGGGRNNRISPIYMENTGSTGNSRNSGNNVHNYRHLSVYNSDSDIIVSSDNDLDADDISDDEDDLEDESNIIDGRLSTDDIDKLHSIVMQGLRLTRIPDISNVSTFNKHKKNGIIPDFTSFRYIFNTYFTDFVILVWLKTSFYISLYRIKYCSTLLCVTNKFPYSI